MALVIAIVIGIPLVAAAITGALQIPRNDDWAFLRIAFHFADTGHFQLVGWNDMMLLGQIVLAYPIVKVAGHSIVLLHLFAAAIAVAGLVATYLVARRFLPERRALLVVLVAGLFPGFGLSATTFMTDAPAYAAQFACLALGFLAFGSTRRREMWLDLALFVGMVGFTIREFSIAAPLAVIVGMFFVERRESDSAWMRAAIRTAAVATIAVALFRLRHALPGDTLGGLGIHLDQREVQHFTQAFLTFAFGVLPAVVWRIGKRAEGTLVNIAAFAVVPLSLYVMARSAGDATCCTNASSSLFVGNLLTEHGAMGNETLMGTRPAMFSAPFWFLVMGWLSARRAVVGARQALFR
ncbi:MAG: glycosyltransferase family 39 protein [Actinomycetota bacterium]|nr:glycosyltransferase family 39 protein [Actinomycetota bacterium]